MNRCSQSVFPMYNAVSIAGFFKASSTASDTIDLPDIDGKPITVMLSNSQRLKESSCLDSLDAFARYFDYGGIEIGKGIYLDRDHECRQEMLTMLLTYTRIYDALDSIRIIVQP